MAFKLNHIVGLLGLSFMLHGFSVFAEQPSVEEVFTLLGMDNLQVAELLQGQPVTYALSEKSEDELGVAVIQYLPLPLAKVVEHLRIEDIGSLEVNVTAHGLLTTNSKVDSLKTIYLSNEDALTLLDAEPGDDFNLSAQELDSLKSFKKSLKYNPHTSISGAVGQHYREILFQRFQAYRQGGTYAIAPYMREDDLESKVSVELHQAAKASFILERYFPDFFKVWLDYPKILPTGAKETFPWGGKKRRGPVNDYFKASHRY
jgi:hypothetical protein